MRGTSFGMLCILKQAVKHDPSVQADFLITQTCFDLTRPSAGDIPYQRKYFTYQEPRRTHRSPPNGGGGVREREKRQTMPRHDTPRHDASCIAYINAFESNISCAFCKEFMTWIF